MKKFIAAALCTVLLLTDAAPAAWATAPADGGAGTAVTAEAPRERTLTDASVTVTGVLPAGTELAAEQIDDPFTAAQPARAKAAKRQTRGDGAADGGWKAAAFYDVKLVRGGKTFQPDEAVTVTIENVPLTGNGMVVVKHFLDSEAAIAAAAADGSAEAVEDAAYVRAFPAEAAAAEAATGRTGVVYVETLTEADGLTVDGSTVTFPAKSFSIYAVGEDEPQYRLNVIFHRTDGSTVETLVKEGDLSSIDTVICDPGAGELPPNKYFRGWTTTQDYTAETPVKNIDGIRQEIVEKVSAAVGAGVTDAETLDVYPMLFNAYSITFKDEAGAVVIKVDNVFFKDETPADERVYTVNEPYTPASADANFVGWKVTSGSENIEAPANGRYYTNETEVVLTGSVVLEPYLENGWWITFVENGRGASYTGPQFVKSGEVSHEPEKEPTRLGFTFDGWYTDPACLETQKFTFGRPLEGRITLYAGWVAADTANYSIIIWKQNVDGERYDFGEVITKVGEVRAVIDDVTAFGTGNEFHAVIDGAAKTYEGFHLRDYDMNVTIVPEGTSVVNVYYDRNEVTLNFYIPGPGTVYIYTETTSNSGTQYGLLDGEYKQLTYSGGTWYYDTGIPGYTPTTSNDQTPQQYGLVNGVYVPLTRRTDSFIFTSYYWEYSTGEYEYERSYSNSTDPQKYGYDPATDQYYPLTRTGSFFGGYTWYMNGVEYTGYRYTRSEKMARYEGTRYIYSESGLEEFTGVRYKRTQSTGWVLYGTYTGPYASRLADNNYIWPTEYDWYDTGNNNGIASGSRTTFLDAFMIPSGETFVNFFGRTAQSGNSVVEFYRQKANLSGYEADPVNTVSSNADNPTFSISDKYNGFRADHYNVNDGAPVQLGEKDGDGYYARGVRYANSTLRIYYNRECFKLNFMDGVYVDGNGNPVVDTVNRGQFKEVDDIAYGADLTDYNKGGGNYYAPTYGGFVFEGWYLDKNCTQPCVFSTMPEGGLSVYAKWRIRQYRVFLHPNVPADEAFQWADANQEVSFRIDYNGVISSGKTVDGVRDGYEIVAWYRDAALGNVFNFESHLTEQTVFDTYDTTRTTELDDYGRPLGEKRTYTDGKEYVWDAANNTWYTEHNDETGEDEMVLWNKDAGKRFWIEQSLDLYAKWRRVITGAKGICLAYDANGGTGAPTNNTLYLDQATVIAGGAPTPPEGSTDVFKYWIVMKWNGTEYEETDEHVLPGDAFTIRLAYAGIEDIPENELGETKQYTMQLKAFYGPQENGRTTSISYDGNGGTLPEGYTPPAGAAVSGNVVIFAELPINANHTLLGKIFSRPGYTFLGWALSASAETPDFTAGQTVAADNLDLTGNPDDNVLYAVWQESTATITYTAVGPDGSGSVSPTSETIPAITGTASGSTATANDGFRFLGWFDNAECTGAPLGTDALYVPAKSGDTWTDAAYYARFEYDTTTLTVTNATGHHAIFTVTGRGYAGANALRVGIPAGESVTVANVYVGETYTVSEEGAWSWRFTAQECGSGGLSAGVNVCSVPAAQPVRTLWLSGCDADRKSKPALTIEQ